MTTLAVELPDQAVALLKYSPSEFGKQMRLAYALRLYAKGEVSQENAALIAGVDNAGFMVIVGREQEEERVARIRNGLRTLQQAGTFAHIKDPVAWQREIRKDRPLPGREG
jgi:predicted HTH domain antitoxin